MKFLPTWQNVRQCPVVNEKTVHWATKFCDYWRGGSNRVGQADTRLLGVTIDDRLSWFKHLTMLKSVL